MAAPSTVPPRSQTTILPAKVPAGAGVPQKASSYGAAAADTTGSGPAPGVMVEPLAENVAPSSAVSVSCEANSRSWVDAATEVNHGPRWFAVPAVGPSLPAEA